MRRKAVENNDCEDKDNQMLGDSNTLPNPGTTSPLRMKNSSDMNIDVKKKLSADVKQMKLTFRPVNVPSVMDNIRMFQMMSMEGGCGRYAEHNVKLCCSVVEKRVGCDNGKTKWRMSEVSILVCPNSIRREFLAE